MKQEDKELPNKYIVEVSVNLENIQKEIYMKLNELIDKQCQSSKKILNEVFKIEDK